MNRGQRGIALVVVLVVLAAMVLLATPFALSMRHLEASALLGQRQERARAGALVALAAARRHLQETHPHHDLDTPHFDGRAEIAPADLAARFPDLLPRDPQGSLRSARIEDESGKISLATASLWLLGNLLGGRTTLAADAAPDATTLALLDGSKLPPAGLALVGFEQVEFSRRGEHELLDVRRGFRGATLTRSRALPHRAGETVLDLRLALLVLRSWHVRPGAWQPPLRVAALQDLGLFGEMTYLDEDRTRSAPHLSVHGAPPRWIDPQPLLGAGRGRSGELLLSVPDGSFFGPGTVVQLTDRAGVRRWHLVLSAARWGDHWRLGLLEEPEEALRTDGVVVRRLARDPVNVCSAAPEVLVALLVGLAPAPVVDVLTDLEAARLALLVAESGLPPDEEFQERYAIELSRAGLSVQDLATARAAFEEAKLRPGQLTVEEMTARLSGLEARRASHPVSPATAVRLATRLAAAQPRSHEDVAGLLAAAVAAGECSSEERLLVLRNAIDPGDARIVGGTAPFAYASAGLFTVAAAASENLPNGREESAVHVREVLSPGVSGESQRVLGSQRDWDALSASSGGRGWASWPSLLRSGPGFGLPGASGEDDPPADMRGALELGGAGVERAATLAALRPGPSDADELSFVEPEPVRSALPDTLHFDEGAPGAIGDSPSGLHLGQRALRLPVAHVQPAVTEQASGRLVPFTVELWFEVDDPAAETVLFDAGADHLEDRVFLMLQRGELVLRASDTSLADFEARLQKGRAPPAGEIRYGFDDGLALQAGVPYHVLASVGGARDDRLALYVDGVPRGRRTFTTRLVEDVDSAGYVGSGPATGSERLRVESTEGFPSEGALRVGDEIVEYVDKTDDTFLVRPAGSADPFGGRSRRGTTGTRHEASEVVELVGYSRPLQSERANQGVGTLGGQYAAFAPAEIDPERAADDLFLLVPVTSLSGATSDLTIPLGTGIDLDTATIPLRGVASGSLAGVFQESGGHAIVFCDYGRTEVVGQPFDPGGTQVTAYLPAKTDRGAWIGGAECIRYERFDGSALQGCRRQNAGIPQSVGPQPSELAGAKNAYVATGGTSWSDPRAWVTSFSPELLGGMQNLPEQARVLVIPISVKVDGVAQMGSAYHPSPSGWLRRDSYLVQVGLDFPEGGDGTEWIRWDTPTSSMLVRDDPLAIDRMLLNVAGTQIWRMDTNPPGDLADSLNDGLEFRGQAGTPDGTHAAGAGVLPVLALGGWGIAGFDAARGIPGRWDRVTLAGDDGAREAQVVNHAETTDRDWAGSCLVAFREPVVGEFAATTSADDERFQASERELKKLLARDGLGDRLRAEFQVADLESLLDRLRPLRVDSRLLTRLVKAPSGELPSLPPGVLHFGENFDQRAAGGVRIDELRLTAQPSPGPLLPALARYRLAHELAFDENRVAELATDTLYYPHARIQDSLLGKDGLEVLGALPSGGGLLLVGQEIVAFAGLDPVDTGAVFLTGRGLYGTRRARHEASEDVVPLRFWPASPLAAGVGADEPLLRVTDPAAFPEDGGLLWIDDEVLAYERRTDEGLAMPEGSGGYGLLRGRFGTTRSAHGPGALVRWLPARVADGALLGEDVPSAEALFLPVYAPGAFFTDLALSLERRHPTVELDARVVLDGRASYHVDPAADPHVLAFERAEISPGLRVLVVGRAADRLEVVLAARWLPGAFDPQGFASSGWKMGPRVDTLLLRHVQPTVTLEHEEWR